MLKCLPRETTRSVPAKQGFTGGWDFGIQNSKIKIRKSLINGPLPGYVDAMDILTQFEEKIDGLLERIRTVEAENTRLHQELESERTQKQDVLHRIDNLLKKIQEAAM